MHRAGYLGDAAGRFEADLRGALLECEPDGRFVCAQRFGFTLGRRPDERGVDAKLAQPDRRFWISVNLDADVPADEVERLVGHSYELVCAGLTRKQKAELAALSA